jgi:cellulose synthase/poly-beta-1,6-N-acetylglucosamine synthase-like glycosyltransferase
VLRDVIGWILAAAGWLLAVPVAMLLLQVIASLLPRSGMKAVPPSAGARARAAVLVPAHDEAAGIAASLATILPQLGPQDRLLVVADNCSDRTASIAAAAGAEVVERSDPSRRGKGYALDHGIRALEAAPPEVVVVVDADCELHPGSLDRLARLCKHLDRPVQALDLMHAPPNAGLKTRIAAFAWVVKNQVRPLGFHRLGLPCQLMGTGMAFPWHVIQGAGLASGHLAEDMKLGLDLARGGRPAMFCPQARVTSTFPTHEGGIAAQRSRWERGHVQVIVEEAPSVLWRGIVSGRPALMALALDLSVPPLTVLVLLVGAVALASGGLAVLGGSRLPLGLSLLEIGCVLLAVGLAWWRFGRAVVSAGDLLRAPLYLLAKLPLYARFGRGKGEWTRARRDDKVP